MRFSPKHSGTRKNCCVEDCKSLNKDDTTLRYHKIPPAGVRKVTITNKFGKQESVDCRFAWLKLLKLRNVTKHSTVCSLHFTADDYLFPEYQSSKRKLKSNSIPSQCLPRSKYEKERDQMRIQDSIERMERYKKRSLEKEFVQTTKKKEHNSVEKMDFIENNQLKVAKNNEVSEDLDPISKQFEVYEHKGDSVNFNESDQLSESNSVLLIDKCIQVNFDVYSKFISNDDDLSTLTGLNNLAMLDSLEQIVGTVNPKIVNICKKKGSKLTVKDKIVLTMIKLKQNYSYKVLGILFQLGTAENCRQIFLTMLFCLSSGLQLAVNWPSKEELLKNISLGFNEYSDVRAIIDVIEIMIETPKEKCCRMTTYSSNKKAYTVRFMISVSLDGLITFISQPYLGGSCDTEIFNDSGFIQLFEKGDALICDKRFLVDDVCAQHDIKLIRPPMVKKRKKNITEEEAIQTRDITKARLHIDKLNHRIKLFKILNSKVPSSLVPKINQIFVICCAIVNLGPPIQ